MLAVYIVVAGAYLLERETSKGLGDVKTTTCSKKKKIVSDTFIALWNKQKKHIEHIGLPSQVYFPQSGQMTLWHIVQ